MVQVASELCFGRDSSDTYEGINFPRMREERAAKAKAVLKEQGIATILVTGEPNVRYLTGFSWAEFQPWLSYTLFFAEHDPVVFAHAGSFQQMPDMAPWIKHWRIGRSWLQEICGPEAVKKEAKLFAQGIKQELQDRGLADEKVGIVGWDVLTRETLKEEGITIVEGWPLLLEASKTKTVDEINCLKLASSFCASGWVKALEVMKPAMERNEVMRHVLGAVSAAGATVSHGGLLSGPMTYERNLTYANRRIEYGNMVYLPLCGTSYMGYTTCLYRQFIVGRKPNAEEKDWFNKMKDRLDVAIEATKIGASTADIAQAFPPASYFGYKDEAEILSIEVGHGIGLVGLAPGTVHYNYPVINRQWSVEHPQIIEEGMVIAYESLEGVRRVGGARMEDVVVATKNGPEIIDIFPRDEILVAGEI